MGILFTVPAPPQLPIAGSDAHFPVRRVFCVGRNYVAHAREMGADPDREPPFFFTKFAETVVPSGSAIPYPPETSDFQFEGELVIAIGGEGFNVGVDEAPALIFGYAVGLDMTRRDLQMAARATGRPWDTGKNFGYSAPVGTIHPVTTVGHLNSGSIRLKVNGGVKQDADLGELIWDCAEIVSALSAFERVQPGDLIFTGTPAGVGPVQVGDHLVVEITGLTPLEVMIAPREAV